MKVLVTGGTGFIGQKLVPYLFSHGCNVSVLSRNDAEFHTDVRLIKMDLLSGSFSFLDDEDFDVIINCAADLQNEHVMEELHVKVPMRMLRRLKGRRFRWVQLSSVGVYGRPVTGEIDEGHIFQARGEYEATKARAEQEISKYCLDEDIEFSILRPSNVFGVGMTNTALRRLVSVIKSGRFFYLADPRGVSMNYVDVDNVVEGLWLCSTKNEAVGQAFNLSDRLSQKEFVSLICNHYGVSVPRLYVPAGVIRMLSYFLCRLPRFPLTPAAISLLTTGAVYPTAKIERYLGFQSRSPLPQALVTYIKSLD